MLNRYCSSDLGYGVVHAQRSIARQKETTKFRNISDKGYLDRLFQQNVFHLRESNSILSGKGKWFTELALECHYKKEFMLKVLIQIHQILETSWKGYLHFLLNAVLWVIMSSLLTDFGCACVRKKSITHENNHSCKLRLVIVLRLRIECNFIDITCIFLFSWPLSPPFIRDHKQHDAVMRRRRSLTKFLFR